MDLSRNTRTTHTEGLPSSYKTKVFISFTSYICGMHKNFACSAIRQIRVDHNYQIPSRQNYLNRPKSDEYEYVNSKENPYHSERYGCPSCWFHCPEGDLAALYRHTVDQHDPIYVNNECGSGAISDDEDHDATLDSDARRSNFGVPYKNESYYQHDINSSGDTTSGSNNHTPPESSCISFQVDI